MSHKTIATLMLITLGLAATACGKDKDKETAPASSTASAVGSEKEGPESLKLIGTGSATPSPPPTATATVSASTTASTPPAHVPGAWSRFRFRDDTCLKRSKPGTAYLINSEFNDALKAATAKGCVVGDDSREARLTKDNYFCCPSSVVP